VIDASIIRTAVGLPLLEKSFVALSCAFACSSVVARMYSSFERPVVPLPRFFKCSTFDAAKTAMSPSMRYSYTIEPSDRT